MYCSKCGNNLPEDVNFCQKCGNQIGDNTNFNNQAVESQINSENTYNSAPVAQYKNNDDINNFSTGLSWSMWCLIPIIGAFVYSFKVLYKIFDEDQGKTIGMFFVFLICGFIPIVNIISAIVYIYLVITKIGGKFFLGGLVGGIIIGIIYVIIIALIASGMSQSSYYY